MGRCAVIFNIFFILSGLVPLLRSQVCDEGKAGTLQEGNLGQDAVFPWLGVLRVHMHEGDSFKIAVTGIVLIRGKFALANAHDVSRIPRDVFKDDSKAMFIPHRDEPWTVPVEDYVVHPEYDYRTLNTIAVVELKIEIDEFIPVKPICWPSYSYNTSNQLYVIGYTDDNKLLEKELRKVQFVKQRHCDEFYSRAGLKEDKVHPVNVQCAFAVNATGDCVWETGQVMASNATGHWTMIGLGVHGPGCAAPARFISLSPYLMWIQSVTELDREIDDYRRSAFGTGFKTGKVKGQRRVGGPNDIPEVPIHETFLRGDNEEGGPETIYHSYRIKFDDPDFYKIDRIDDDAIDISVFDKLYESPTDACKAHDILQNIMYYDETKIVAKGIHGSAVYRLTVHDMTFIGYSCIKVKVKSLRHERPKLWWRQFIDKYESTLFEDMGRLPKKLLKILPLKIRNQPPGPSDKYVPGGHMEPHHVFDERDYEGLENINILIKLTFRGSATLIVKVYGHPPPIIFPTTPPSEFANNTNNTLILREDKKGKSLRLVSNKKSDDYKYNTTPKNYQTNYESEDLTISEDLELTTTDGEITSETPNYYTEMPHIPLEIPYIPTEKPYVFSERPRFKTHRKSFRKNKPEFEGAFSKNRLQKAMQRETERRRLHRKLDGSEEFRRRRA